MILVSVLVLMGAAYVSAGTDNVAEEVAWVVGDQPIWKSDIEEAYQNMLYEKVPINGDPYCWIPGHFVPGNLASRSYISIRQKSIPSRYLTTW